jgi:hypothetical protein
MTRSALCLAALACLTASVYGDVVKNISTGINDSTLVKIPNNSPDPDFIIGAGSVAHTGETPIARSTPLPPPFFSDADSSDSRWLALNTGIGEEGVNVVQGTYFFETQVNLAGFAASTAQITGLRYGGDDKMNEITVNGISVWTRPIAFGGDFFEWHEVGNLGSGSFATGINTIRFNVSNEPEPPTVMALRVEGSVTATVPEPSVCLLVSCGLMCAIGRRPARFHAKFGTRPRSD